MILTVEQASSKRKSTEKKKNKKSVKKQKIESGKKKKAPKKASDKIKYFYYNVESHWRRNYPTYLVTVKNKKKDAPSE